MKKNIPRIMFAAPCSGSGKTTIVCAVLKALMDIGNRAAAFKCGPDYIDPMFHTEVIGAKSRNLDLFMLSEDTCKYLLAKNSEEADISILEGVMGYYDGLSGTSVIASSYHLADVTKTPVILIVECKGASLSVAATIKGFMTFREKSNIQGVILNNLSEDMFPLYKKMIESETGSKVLGFFPHMKECRIESRHLGLITATEIDDLNIKIKALAEQAKRSIDLSGLLEIGRQAENLDYEEQHFEKLKSVTIAVARDKAFCFYYQDSLDLLEAMGAKLIYFSPLKDKHMPECHGLVLGGGYPELYAEELSQNHEMAESIRKALNQGLPCIAECGGFMYLLETLQDKCGVIYAMSGFIAGKAFMTDRLTRFGYITLTANEDSLLADKGEQINAHEFHYSDAIPGGESFTASKPITGKSWSCIHGNQSLHAGYPHIHLWGNPPSAAKFINKCLQYKG